MNDQVIFSTILSRFLEKVYWSHKNVTIWKWISPFHISVLGFHGRRLITFLIALIDGLTDRILQSPLVCVVTWGKGGTSFLLIPELQLFPYWKEGCWLLKRPCLVFLCLQDYLQPIVGWPGSLALSWPIDTAAHSVNRLRCWAFVWRIFSD